ncbi:hypothetical protein [Kitasatospora sp. NPDC088346]|uniref:hypothetical protein n=1 Tax=Kitasatospora sp. NPDC088346 TaxID=3364073 RepID=UPI00382AEF12
MTEDRRRLGRALAVAAVTLATGAATLAVAPAGAAAEAAPAAAAPTQLVLPAAPRGIPGRDQLYVAGDTGLLHAREGSDHLLWTRYDTGATTDTGLRLPAPLGSNLEDGVPSRRYAGRPDNRYGSSSDTVAVPGPPAADGTVRVELHDLASRKPVSLGAVDVPAGQTYDATFGRTVVSHTGTDGSATGWYLNTLQGAAVVRTQVSGIPAGAPSAWVDGDRTSALLSYRLDDGNHWLLLDLATGTTAALPDEAERYSGGFRLAKDGLLRLDGNGTVDVLDRTAPWTVRSSGYVNSLPPGGYDAEYRRLGDWVLTTLSAVNTSGDNRGRPVTAVPLAGPGSQHSVLDSADTQLLPAPDGSLIAVGSEHPPAYGDRDTFVYRITPNRAGEPTLHRLTRVPTGPATVFGLAIGGGTLSVASDTVSFSPADSTGSFRSYRISDGTPPVKLSETLDSAYPADDCYGGRAACTALWATGDGRYLPAHPSVNGRTVVMRAGSQEWGATFTTGLESQGSVDTVDADGRYAVFGGYRPGWTYARPTAVVDLDTGTTTLSAPLAAAAVRGTTLWSAKQDSTTVTATDPTGATVRDSFTTPCAPTRLQAVSRWVYWGCQNSWDGALNASGVFDTVTRSTLTVPVQSSLNTGGPDQALLGDGYLVRQDLAGGRLLLVDFHDGIAASGAESAAQVRRLASGAYWKTPRQPRKAWAVDRTGTDVVWVDADQHRIHVVPSGVPRTGAAATPAGPTG